MARENIVHLDFNFFFRLKVHSTYGREIVCISLNNVSNSVISLSLVDFCFAFQTPSFSELVDFEKGCRNINADVHMALRYNN